MHSTMLALILTLMLTPVLWAEDPTTSVKVSNAFFVSPQTANAAAEGQTSPGKANRAVFSNRRIPSLGELEGEPVCYQIRSYLVAQDDPDSDSTSFAGYSTCQWSSRFSVKQARPDQRPAPELDPEQ